MNSKLAIKSSSSVTATGDKGVHKDDVSRIQQDITIITQRIAEITGTNIIESNDDSSVTTVATHQLHHQHNQRNQHHHHHHQHSSAVGNAGTSPFVINIRSLAKDPKESKLSALEILLQKISEYDRLLLKHTSPVTTDPNAPPQRRKSIGIDLYAIPTYLHLTSRLMDLHTQSKRVTVIKTSNHSHSGDSHDGSSSQRNSEDKKMIDELKTTMAQLIKQIEESQDKLTDSNKKLEYSRKNFDDSNKKIEELQKKLEDSDKKLIDTDMKLKDSAKKLEDSNKSLADSAKRLQDSAQKLLTSEVECNQYMKCNDELKQQILSIEKNSVNSSVDSEHLQHEIQRLKEQIQSQQLIIDNTQERLEIESGLISGILNIILGKTARYNDVDKDIETKGDDCFNMVSYCFSITA
jgi:predicted  nucleic acid-binding Zn-ribbon protein